MSDLGFAEHDLKTLAQFRQSWPQFRLELASLEPDDESLIPPESGSIVLQTGSCLAWSSVATEPFGETQLSKENLTEPDDTAWHVTYVWGFARYTYSLVLLADSGMSLLCADWLQECISCVYWLVG